MAKRSSQRRQAPPDSKKTLIILLVFFILTTIGGGLFGYQGFIADEGKVATINDEKSKAKKAEEESLFFKYQALLYRRYLGQEKAKEELDKFDKQFKEATEGWTQHKDRNDVITLAADVEKCLKQVAPDKGPIKNYDEAVKAQALLTKAAQDAIVAPQKEKDAGLKDAADSKAMHAEAKIQYAKALKDVAEKLQGDQAKDIDAKKILDEALKASSANFEKLALEKADIEKKSRTDLAARDKTIAELTKQLSALSTELALAKATTKDLDMPDFQLKAAGRVVDRRGDSAFINLGLVQKMTPQMTFSIHAVGGDGLPLPASKGSMEVVNVFEAGSQGRIVVEKNKSNPIETGDVIVNPNWNPNRKRHVAIAGLADLTGEGRNQMREFRQMLERQNTEVDAFLELAGNDWVVTGKGISRETNYLILGGDMPDSKDAASPAQNLQKQIPKMVEQARANGVLIVSLRNYLDMIGYQPPRGLGDSSSYQPGVVAAPAEKKEPAPMPMKEPAPMKDMEKN